MTIWSLSLTVIGWFSPKITRGPARGYFQYNGVIAENMSSDL